MGKIFGFIFVPLGWLIRTFYSWTHNYLISILLFALVIEIILSPLQIKQQKNSIKQAKLAPKINAIRKRYAGLNDNVSKQRMNQDIMEVYQQEGFNPAGGCLPMLIQLPIVLCVYQVIINPLTYLSGLSSEIITAIKTATDEVQKAFYSISEKLYQQQAAQGQAQGQPGAAPNDDGVVDADYEVVDDE